MNRRYYLDEIWKPIQGYEGRYEISNYGRVKSLNYRKKGIEKILRTTAKIGYYIKVGLRDCMGKVWYYRIHRLVAFAFLPPPLPGQTQVEHLDSNKRNNYVKCYVLRGQVIVMEHGSNLRWTTPKGNMANEETRRRISEGNKNPSPEVRARRAKGQKGRFARERATKTGRYAPPRV